MGERIVGSEPAVLLHNPPDSAKFANLCREVSMLHRVTTVVSVLHTFTFLHGRLSIILSINPDSPIRPFISPLRAKPLNTTIRRIYCLRKLNQPLHRDYSSQLVCASANVGNRGSAPNNCTGTFTSDPHFPPLSSADQLHFPTPRFRFPPATMGDQSRSLSRF